MTRTKDGAKGKTILVACVLLVAGVVGVVVWSRSRAPALATVEPGATAVTSTNRAQLARLVDVLLRLPRNQAVPRPAMPMTDDERIRARAAGDPVGTMMPILAGLPKPKQLEMLKVMMTWPDSKLMFHIPELANQIDRPFAERSALAEEIAGALIESLEQEGYHYDLPVSFQPVGAALAPPPADQIPPHI